MNQSQEGKTRKDLKPPWNKRGQKLNRVAPKMNIFTTLVELWNYDSRNLISKKDSFFEQLYGPYYLVVALAIPLEFNLVK